MKKKNLIIVLTLVALATALILAGVWLFMKENAKPKEYPGVKRYIYFDDKVIDTKNESDFKRSIDLITNMSNNLVEYMRGGGIKLEQYVADGIVPLIDKRSNHRYANFVEFTLHHTNPEELKLIEEKIEEYPEVEEVRETERPRGSYPGLIINPDAP